MSSRQVPAGRNQVPGFPLKVRTQRGELCQCDGFTDLETEEDPGHVLQI